MEYYSAIKKNEIMPFAATWVDLEIITLSESKSDRERQIWYRLYAESKKNDPNELTYKTETDSQIRKQIYGYQRGKAGTRDKLRVWD